MNINGAGGIAIGGNFATSNYNGNGARPTATADGEMSYTDYYNSWPIVIPRALFYRVEVVP